ncbi:MAG TPA: ATP-binding protein [Opitutaceae bacterium]|jgi:hypothetical protein|nr:ATP-binding protein [Opitutaceae bacterium]
MNARAVSDSKPLRGQPWVSQADEIKETGEISLDDVITTGPIEAFLDNDWHNPKFLVSGARGTGKTLLIRLKSAMYREKKTGTHFIPNTELVERLDAANVSFSDEDLSGFTQPNIWVSVWRICLEYVILRSLGTDLPSALTEFFGEANRVASVLPEILRNRGALNRLLRLKNQELTARIENLDRPVAMFIDSVDEALSPHVGYTFYEFSQARDMTQGNLDPAIWMNAQVGLFEAIKQIHHVNHHIRIFAAIRHEAYAARRTASHQDSDYVCEIEYTPAKLRQIFVHNITRTDRTRLAKPDAADPITQFFGYPTLEHAFVRSPNGDPVSEDIFDFILRHTFGRPREVVTFGQIIYHEEAVQRTPERIRQLIHTVASKGFNYFQKEIIPFWNYKVARELFLHAHANVLTLAEVRRIARSVTATTGHKHPFCYLISRGLIGYTMKEDHGARGLVQRFEIPGEHAFNEEFQFPQSRYFIFHPAVGSQLLTRDVNFRLDRLNIIGDGRPFTPAPTHSTRPRPGRAKLHVHVGAGRLGLGFCLPTLHKSFGVCMIQRPNSRFQPLLNLGRVGERVILHVGFDETIPLYLLDGRAPKKTIQKVVSAWKKGSSVLVLSRDTKLLAQFFNAAGSFSTSLGKPDKSFVADYASLFPHGSPQRPLLAFENDSVAVACFANQCDQAGLNLDIIPVCADCICSGFIPRVDATAEGEMSIYVHSETYGNAVARCVTPEVWERFQKVPKLQVEHDEEAFTYAYQRKLYLVNGLHFYLYTLACVLLSEEQLQATLVPAFSRETEIDRLLKCYIRISALRLITEHWPVAQVVEKTNSADETFRRLIENGNVVLNRISIHYDKMSRLTPDTADGFLERYEARANHSAFVDEHWKELVSIVSYPMITESKARNFCRDFDKSVRNVAKQIQSQRQKSSVEDSSK